MTCTRRHRKSVAHKIAVGFAVVVATILRDVAKALVACPEAATGALQPATRSSWTATVTIAEVTASNNADLVESCPAKWAAIVQAPKPTSSNTPEKPS